MLILITILLLIAAAIGLILLRVLRPEFRFAWLTAVSAVFLAWITLFLWLLQLPLSLNMPSWTPTDLFSSSPSLQVDGLLWPYAFSLVTLAIAILLTASAREGFPDSLGWAVSLIMCALGLLAVTAGNPLTLVLVWGAVDLAELVIMVRTVKGSVPSEASRKT